MGSGIDEGISSRFSYDFCLVMSTWSGLLETAGIGGARLNGSQWISRRRYMLGIRVAHASNVQRPLVFLPRGRNLARLMTSSFASFKLVSLAFTR